MVCCNAVWSRIQEQGVTPSLAAGDELAFSRWFHSARDAAARHHGPLVVPKDPPAPEGSRRATGAP